MRYEIIVEWFDTKTETDKLAVYEAFGALFEAKKRARRYLKSYDRESFIPTCARVEDDKENVVAMFDWIDGKARVRKEAA